ncbi:MAG: type II secretion system protein GspG [Phycisphaeraceae bacterium]|nr:type II secretion system protein GspG [Phycisphaeraceae bacterium]
MSESREPSLLLRFWYTPIRDIIRWRVSCRLDWRRTIVQASIPDETKALLTKLVRRTRLWRMEKADIARELVAHFEDAIAAGQSGDEAVKRFGDWSKTAKLIRRATKRKRNLLWHAWRWAFWCVVALIGLYTAMGVYYFTGSRNIAVDYTVAMNVEAAAVPEDQRAWPVVRRAMLAMGYTQPPAEPAEGQPNVYSLISERARPGEDGWPVVTAFLNNHAGAMSDLRRAAGMPGLGFIAGYETDIADLPLFDPGKTLQEHESDARLLKAQYADEPPMVWMILLEHLTSLRSAGRVLSVDTFRALDAGDADTAYANLVAMLGIADHADEQNTLINQLVTISIRQLMYQTLSEALAAYPASFSSQQLAGLAHQIAAGRGYKPGFDGERAFMMDLIQHLYTDNGRGNGHLDARAWRRLASELSSFGGPGYFGISDEADFLPTVIGTAVSPAAVMVVADRKDMTAMVDRFYTLYEAEVSLPMWEHPESKAEAELSTLIEDSLYQRTRYFPIAWAMPALGAVRKVAERHTAYADGALTALALELYKADHGAYPDTLEALVPRYLPTMPIDRITGGPLNDTLKDGRPVLYSVGADRDDDNGTAAYDADGDREQDVIQWVIGEGHTAVDGDWVVWPLHDEAVDSGQND